jgi:Ran GTPase-activating protein 1
MADPRVFSLLGKSLKFETRADIEPHLASLDVDKVEEIVLGGNTYGVEACYAIADKLKQTKKLRVRPILLCPAGVP